MEPKALLNLQRQFKSIVQASRPETAQQLRLISKPPLTSEERLQIYQYAYEARLLEALEEDFPMTQEALGQDRFADLITLYLAQFPSRYASLAEVGQNLSNFLKSSSLVDQYPFLVDLTRFEWLQVLSAFALEVPIVEFKLLQKLTPHQLNQVIFELHPSVHLFRSNWPLHQIDALSGTFQRSFYFVIYKSNGGVQFKEVSSVQWSLLHEIRKKAALQELVQFLVENQESEKNAFNWFSHWTSEGIIHRFYELNHNKENL